MSLAEESFKKQVEAHAFITHVSEVVIARLDVIIKKLDTIESILSEKEPHDDQEDNQEF